MLKLATNYDEVRNSFEWEIPKFYNIGVDICDKWAGDPDRLALIHETSSGETRNWTFRELRDLSNRLANGLRSHGIVRGERIGILLGQGPETALTHIAAYKLGAVAIPLFNLFGVDALEYRLSNSGASAVVTDDANVHKILEIWDNLPDLRWLLVTETHRGDRTLDFWNLIEKGSTNFEPVKTNADEPALIIYTSGTTGSPKGVMLTFLNLMTNIKAVSEFIPIYRPDSRVMVLLPLHHIFPL